MFDQQDIKRAGLEEALRQIPAAAFIAEAPSGKIILVNERAQQMIEQNLGRSMPADLGSIEDFSDLEVFHPDGRPLEIEEWPLVRSIGSGEEVRDEEYDYLLAGGTRLWLRCSSSPIYDNEGHIVAGVLLVRDITGRKRAEEQLAYHVRLLENMHDAVIAMDDRLVVKAWNKGAEEIYGWRADEVLGRDVREVVPPDRSEEQWTEALRELDQTGRFRAELIMYHKDGTPVHTEVIIAVLRGEQGQITGYLSINRDITERKGFEAERQRLVDIVQESSDFIGFAGLDWRPTFLNEAGQRLVGLNGIEEVRRTRVQDYLMPEDRAFVWDELFPTVMEQGRWVGEFTLRHFETGEPIPVLWDVFRVDDPETGEPVGFATVTRDITERKRAEEALRESEGHLRFVLEAGGLGSWELDLTTYELESSETCKRNFGLPPGADLPFERLLSMIHPDDRDPMRGAVEAAIATGSDYEADYRIITPGGEVCWVAARGRVVYAPDGAPSSMTGITLDITKRKRDEERLRESKRRNEEILESITDGFYAMDRHWRFTYLNARAVRFASQLAGEEFTHEGLLGRTLWETLPATVGTKIEEQYRRAVRDQQTVIFEYPYPVGGPIFEVYAYPSEQGLSIYFRDITERKLAEKEIETRAAQQATVAELGLRALANEDLQAFMDYAVSLVAWTLDLEYCKIVEILPGGEELLMRAGVGWKEGLVGNATEGAGLDSQAGYTLRSGEPVIVEDLHAETRFIPSWVLREHGVVSSTTVVIPGRDVPFGVLGAHTGSPRTFTEDDTNFLQGVANVLATAVEREKVEEKLREVREAERSRMARNLHDEALQDLAYAMSQAQLLRATSEEPARRLERLSTALKRVEQQLRGAIYDLRLGAEQDKPFSELLESLVELHRQMVPDCEVRLDVGDGTPSGPLGESGREILRIVGEALTNARRHSRARGVQVSVETSENKLYAEVSDDGRGFDPKEPSASEAGGTGIKGMRERARALGGDLKIKSKPGEGTKVRFELALKKDREEPEEEMRILLVEDHAAVREAIASAFEREAGFEVTGQAGSLAEARRMLEEVDVAVVDLGLPDGYGGDLIKDLREANPRAQTLVLSASLDRAETARAVEAGAAGVLHKTAHLDEVVEAVRRLRAGETLMPLEEVVELLRFAGSQREQEHEARQAIVRLTPREKEVLQALAEGLDSAGIAEKLHISLRTERNHMASILAKLGVHSQLQALVFALRHGLVEIRK